MKKVSFSAVLILLYLIWFATPVLRYMIDGKLNIVPMSLYCSGMFFYVLIYKKNKPTLSPLMNLVLVFVAYVLFLAMKGAGNISGSVRILISYWLPLFAFLQIEDNEDDVRLFVKVLLIIFGITIITTYINLLTDPSVSRLLTSSDTEREIAAEYKIKNCGDIYLIQSMVLMAPFLVNNIKRKIYRKLSVSAIIFIGVMLIQASFTTSLLVFSIILIISLIYNSNMDNILKFVFFVLCALLVFFYMQGILERLIEWIPNEHIKERLNKLVSMKQNGDVEWGRYELYKISFHTFLIFFLTGVGPYYFKWGYGIGNHSQILDDWARYGFMGVVFYIAFFVCYYRFLKKRWESIGSGNVVLPYMTGMMLFLLLNPGFRGNMESIVTLFIMPGLPAVLQKKQNYNGEKNVKNI